MSFEVERNNGVRLLVVASLLWVSGAAVWKLYGTETASYLYLSGGVVAAIGAFMILYSSS